MTSLLDGPQKFLKFSIWLSLLWMSVCWAARFPLSWPFFKLIFLVIKFVLRRVLVLICKPKKNRAGWVIFKSLRNFTSLVSSPLSRNRLTWFGQILVNKFAQSHQIKGRWIKKKFLLIFLTPLPSFFGCGRKLCQEMRPQNYDATRRFSCALCQDNFSCDCNCEN